MPYYGGTETIMNLSEKIKILADSAKYDVSCSSSGSSRKNNGGTGNGHVSGICHTWSTDGRCVSLLKILFSNKCVYDCAYCVNRRSNDVPRAEFSPEELANLTMEFYRRNYIEGLFLSSAVMRSPDYTSEFFLKTLRLLRNVHKFFGYIHVKIIPGTNEVLINQIGQLADRVSVNIELPTEKSLNLLAPQKTKASILTPMKQIKQAGENALALRKTFKSAPSFVPAGQTTQMIIGAGGESDLQIMSLTQGLYDKFSLKRVYYSAYIPAVNHPLLPALNYTPPLLREHRLYQADWLLRFYGFRADELVDQYNPFLSEKLDPKCAWAIRNPQLFPVDINKAPYEIILRVPGIGVTSAKRIITARRHTSLRTEHLKKIGVVLKRAKYFIVTADDHKYAKKLQFSPTAVGLKLADSFPDNYGQISFFDEDCIKPVLQGGYNYGISV